MQIMMVMECEDNESRILKDICTLRDYKGGDKDICFGALNLLVGPKLHAAANTLTTLVEPTN